MDDCGPTSATSRPSTTPSPPSTRPSDATGRRSSAFAREDSGTPSRSADGPSEVQRQLGRRTAAADEHPAVGWWLERVGVVGDVALEQSALAVVARPVPAPEVDLDVAGFGEVEQAGETPVPGHGEAAAGERDDGPRAGRTVVRCVGRPVADLDDAGAVGGDGAEDLRGDPIGGDAAGGECGAHRSHEGVRPAEVVVGARGNARPAEHPELELPCEIVVRAGPASLAVGDETVTVREHREELVD